MVKRILYVYCGNFEIPPYDQTGMNFTALVVDGKTVDTSAGLGAERIKNDVRMAVNSGYDIILNEHPKGEKVTARLDSDLEREISTLIEGGKK